RAVPEGVPVAEDLAGLGHAQAAVRDERWVLLHAELLGLCAGADDDELAERRRRRLLPGSWLRHAPVGPGCGRRPRRSRSILRRAPFQTVGSFAPNGSATSSSTRGSQLPSSTDVCRTATFSWSIHRGRSGSFCTRMLSVPRPS